MAATPRDTFALIGGSGAHELLRSQAHHCHRLGPAPTPFGLSAPLYRVRLGEARFLFLPRHGETGYEVAAPWVNYRASIYALKEQGVERIVSWSAVRAVDVSLSIGQYVLPHDLIDGTRGREGSFYKGTGLGVLRQQPVFCPEMREAVEHTLSYLGLTYADHGLYACTQGPRLETPAEIRGLRSSGANLVGMTLAPEAFLARALEICYLPICYIAAFAEGVRESQRQPEDILDDVKQQAEREAAQQALDRFFEISSSASRSLAGERSCPCALAMERYRRENHIGDDWRAWIGKP